MQEVVVAIHDPEVDLKIENTKMDTLIIKLFFFLIYKHGRI